MAANRIPSFLASGARLGQWWAPPEEDDEIGPGGLPTLREVGILASSEAGHWSLLIARVRTPGDGTIGDPWSTQLQRRDTIWGQVSSGTCVSLLDGMRVQQAHPFGDSPEERWVGNWSAESKAAWVRPEDRAKRVEIEFDMGAAWSESPRGYGYDVDLADSWCYKSRTFVVPDPIVHEARIGGARLQLRRECEVEGPSLASFGVRARTYFRIDDDVAFREIARRWVRPLFEFLSFFWLQDAKVVQVQAVDSEHGRRFDLHYPQPLDSSRSPPEGTVGNSPFCNLGDLLAKGYDFETLLQEYFAWRTAGYAPAVFRLVDSQNPLLDHSVGARLLSAIRSLEAFEKARSRKLNVKKAVDRLISTSGTLGSEITKLWAQRGGRTLANSLPELRDRYAAHGRPGDEGHFPPESELLDQEWHLKALQWLLRRRYLEEMGLDPLDTIDLVTNAIGYEQDCEAIRQHYQKPSTTPS